MSTFPKSLVLRQNHDTSYFSGRRPDNLKPEGQIEVYRQEWATHGERMDIVKHKDNLRLEGKFERKAEEKWYPADKPFVVKRKDSLKMEGDMEKRIIPEWAPG